MKIELPQTIMCSVSANSVRVKGVLVIAELGMSYKNPYNIFIGPTDELGNAQITAQQIVEEADKQMGFFLMDYKPIKDFFTGVVTVRIVEKIELEKAVGAYELFKDVFRYGSNYKDNLNQAIETLGTIEKDKLKLNAFVEPSNIKVIIR